VLVRAARSGLVLLRQRPPPGRGDDRFASTFVVQRRQPYPSILPPALAPSRAREIVLQAFIDGLTPRELAESLDCSTGTAMTRLSRARARLADAMAS
jgi:hypothetical protein